jgi:hypothetical protein
MNADRLVTSTEVKSFFGYGKKSSSSFWQFIRSRGVPHIYVGPRRIMFDPYALNHWLEKRNTSTAPRQFEFRSDGRVTWDKSREVPQIDLNPIPKGRTLSNEDVEQIAMRVSCLIAAYLPSRTNKQLTSELADFIERRTKQLNDQQSTQT